MTGPAGYFHKITDALAAASCCGKIHAEFSAFWQAVANHRACSCIPSDAGLQSMMYARWWGDKLWTLIPSSAIVGQFLQTFKEYPPSQASGTFGIEKALKLIEAGSSGGGK
jgi:hypothetical protein